MKTEEERKVEIELIEAELVELRKMVSLKEELLGKLRENGWLVRDIAELKKKLGKKVKKK